jgi:hypothetical protein
MTKKYYNQPATLVSHLHPMSILCASDPAIGGSGDPIGGGDPGSGI